MAPLEGDIPFQPESGVRMASVARRRLLIIGGAFIATSWSAWALSRHVRLGVLGPRKNSILLPSVLGRLDELGYREGRNLSIEYRSADGVVTRFPSLARELIKAKCDLIIAVGTDEAAKALVNAKANVPIVFLANDYDPVQAGIIADMRRPGGNVTGVFLPTLEISAKRVEIMQEFIPKLRRLLVLADNFTNDQLQAVSRAAKSAHIEIILQKLEVLPYNLGAAIANGRSAGAQALVALVSPVLFDQRKELEDTIIKYGLPAVAGASAWGERGYLFTYGADYAKAFARAGDMVASILGGAKAGDLPVEQATAFEFVVNLKVARTLGIKVPQAVLARANRVIE